MNKYIPNIKAFYNESKLALNQLTHAFKNVWPMAVGLWNLRCEVKGILNEKPDISNNDLDKKFSLGSDIKGVNLKSFCENSWSEQKEWIGWLLLNTLISTFEGYLTSLASIFSNMTIKNMQFPNTIEQEIIKIVNHSSLIMHRTFYSVYKNKKDRDYDKIVNLMKCYRVFKELRNCLVHNGGIADKKLCDAYLVYQPIAFPSYLGLKKELEIIQPAIDNKINVSDIWYSWIFKSN